MKRVLIYGIGAWNDFPRMHEFLEEYHAEHGVSVILSAGGPPHSAIEMSDLFSGARQWAKIHEVPFEVLRPPPEDLPRSEDRADYMIDKGRPDMAIQSGDDWMGVAMWRGLDAAGVPVIQFK